MAFHPDGLCLFSGGKDLLKVYGWEPSECHDSIPISWGDVADITLTQNQLVCFIILSEFHLFIP